MKEIDLSKKYGYIIIPIFIYGLLIAFSLRFQNLYLGLFFGIIFASTVYFLQKTKLTVLIDKKYLNVMRAILGLVVWTIFAYNIVVMAEYDALGVNSSMPKNLSSLPLRIAILGIIILSFFEAKKE